MNFVTSGICFALFPPPVRPYLRIFVLPSAVYSIKKDFCNLFGISQPIDPSFGFPSPCANGKAFLQLP
uniref:Uncharacterized protein n=1 Tax=Cucumis sativus TaxID=3659 RepID=A0A0A0KG40_CUCSA